MTRSSSKPTARPERRGPTLVEKIISGGQTGVDRAALDFAIAHNIAHGGFCPKGRRALDGVLPAKYQLIETQTPVYSERTEKNLTIADGTLILHDGFLTGGTQLTAQLCHKKSRPLLIVNWNDVMADALDRFKTWTSEYRIRTLNVAGPRDTADHEVYQRAMQTLEFLKTGFKARS